MRKYDCFLYCGEDDLLDVRVRLHKDIADVTVVVEANRSFRNRMRPLSFPTKRYPWIRYIPVIGMPPYNGNPWDYEAFIRRQVLRGTTDSKPEDLMILTDLDELLKPDLFRSLTYQSTYFVLESYCYALNVGAGYGFTGPLACPQPLFKDPFSLRLAISLMQHPPTRPMVHWLLNPEDWPETPNAGWHFGFTNADIHQRIHDSSHDEMDRPSIHEGLEDARRNLMDPYRRPGIHLTRLPTHPLPIDVPPSLLDLEP